MLIVDENSQLVILDSIYGPILSNHIWVLDLALKDFTLVPIVMLEETVCASIELKLDDVSIVLPAHWSILIYDVDTLQLDVCEISDTLGREFTALVYNSANSMYTPCNIVATNYIIEYTHVSPAFTKSQMLCYPISNIHWILISPSNTYNKYLKDTSILDILY